MMTDPFPNLLLPTCAECAGIGITNIPELLWAMEDACGEEVMKAMVLHYGGREFGVKKPCPDKANQSLIDQGKAWIYQYRGVGRIVLPKGPAARNSRLAWTVYKLLKEGKSLNAVSEKTGADLRTVCNIKKRLRQIGAIQPFDK
jgi:hypothetical protein